MTRSQRPIVAVTALVVITIVAGALWWHREVTERAHGVWDPPSQMHLQSMREMPVTGWRTATSDLGLPPDALFVTGPTAAQSSPLVGFVGNRSYFLATGTRTASWWLVGLDTRTGEALFPPVSLASDTTYRPDCYLNGPSSVLCVRPGGSAHVAWIIDTLSGGVLFHGPTSLTQQPGHNSVEQVGIYAVASQKGQGAFGVGNRSQTTWMVGGNGEVNQGYRAQSDLGEPALGTQNTGGAATARKTVFRLSDGKVLSPESFSENQGLDAAIYPGGFAVEVSPAGRLADPDRVVFFDPEGRQIGHVDTTGSLATDSRNLPMIVTTQGTTVYTVRGDPLAHISSDGAAPDTVLIGSRLMVNLGGGATSPEWTQFDLQTGSQGPTCQVNFSNYLGTDGAVAVLRILDPASGRIAKAVDLANCQTLWTLQARPDSHAQVWRVNSTLVQVSDDGTELVSLVEGSS
jgi:hypothetical protein